MKINYKNFRISNAERGKYVLSEKRDFEILFKIKELEKLKLKKEDKFLVKLIRTQLESDWRKHLLKTLYKLLNKY